MSNVFGDKYRMLASNISRREIKPRKFNDTQFVISYSLEVLRFLIDSFSKVAHLLPEVQANDGNRLIAVYEQLKV